MPRFSPSVRIFSLCACFALVAAIATAQPAPTPIVLHAARLLQVDTGTLPQPGEVRKAARMGGPDRPAKNPATSLT
jgi:hypothetical protein